MDESVDANPYTVGAEEPRRAADPLRFDRLPRELQSEVLKHTHVRFVVTYHTEVACNALGLSWVAHPQLRRLPFVPVVLILYNSSRMGASVRSDS